MEGNWGAHEEDSGEVGVLPPFPLLAGWVRLLTPKCLNRKGILQREKANGPFNGNTPRRADLDHHKVRCALSMLGICIGVGAFICSVAIGRGASSQIDERVKNLSADLIQVEAGGRNVNGARSGTHGTTSLTLKDAQAIEQQIPS